MNKAFLSMAVSLVAMLAVSGAWAQPEIKSATYTITNVKQYNIQVVRINGQSLTVDVEGFGRRRFDVPRGFTFDIDGEDMTLNQILPGQKLRAYVTETETGELLLVQNEGATTGVLGETVTEADDAVAENDAGTASAEAPPLPGRPAGDVLTGESFESPPTELPTTADNRGWMAILGSGFLVAGLFVSGYRRREKVRAFSRAN